jgi:hypothetical protein
LNALLAGKRVPNLETALTTGAPPTWKPEKTDRRPPFENPGPESA